MFHIVCSALDVKNNSEKKLLKVGGLDGGVSCGNDGVAQKDLEDGSSEKSELLKHNQRVSVSAALKVPGR